MLSIPNRLFDESFITTFFRSPNLSVIKKNLSDNALNRNSYISQHVISVVFEGEQRIHTYDGELISVQAGEMVCLKRGFYTVTDLINQGKGFLSYLIFFDDEILGQILNQNHKPEKTEANNFFKFKRSEIIKFYFESLNQFYQLHPTQNQDFWKLKTLEFFTLWLENTEREKILGAMSQLQIHKNRNIQLFMEENFDKPLTVEDYAYLTGRSESTFRREFKERYGKSPRQWLISKRLEKAKQLLQTTNMTVTEVSFEIGYENISHFIKEFKKQFTITPKQMVLQKQELSA